MRSGAISFWKSTGLEFWEEAAGLLDLAAMPDVDAVARSAGSSRSARIARRHATASKPSKLASDREGHIGPKFRGIGCLQESRHFGEKSREMLLSHVNRSALRRLAAWRLGGTAQWKQAVFGLAEVQGQRLPSCFFRLDFFAALLTITS